jgi:hypothetical protein
LEIGAQHSIQAKDNAAFERYVKLLKVYYFDIQRCARHFGSLLILVCVTTCHCCDFSSTVSESPYMYEIMGAYLILLLVEGRISDFHIVRDPLL